MTRIDEWASKASPTATDALLGIDVADTTDAAAGTKKRFLLSSVKTFVLNGLQLAWGSITGTPTTLAGYGITDAASSSALSSEASTRASADTTLQTNITANNTAISNHTAATTSVHGIADTSKLQSYGRTTFNNADATISAGTHYLAQIGTMSAARTVILPAASAVPAGFELIVEDASRTITAANTITIQRAGSDTVNGGTSTVLSYPGQRTTLISDGVSQWTTAGERRSIARSWLTASTYIGPNELGDLAALLAAGYTKIDIAMLGAGGSGGSGRRGADSTTRGAGGAGAPGAVFRHTFDLATLAGFGNSATLVVGAGRAGAAAVTTDSTDGNTGTQGGNTTFTIGGSFIIKAGGGGAGGAGTSTDSGAGGSNAAATLSADPITMGGAGGNTGDGAWGGFAWFGGGGGGGGGGIDAANTTRAGGVGGQGSNIFGPALVGMGGGAGTGAAGGAGAAPTFGYGGNGGAGGGSGDAAGTVAGGAGGAGSQGAGGGGGGGSTNGANSGAGGASGDGAIWVTIY